MNFEKVRIDQPAILLSAVLTDMLTYLKRVEINGLREVCKPYDNFILGDLDIVSI